MKPKTKAKRGGWSGGPVSSPSRRGIWLIFAAIVAALVVAVAGWMASV